MTALKVAFAKAGVTPTGDRANAIFVAALAKHPRHLDKATMECWRLFAADPQVLCAEDSPLFISIDRAIRHHLHEIAEKTARQRQDALRSVNGSGPTNRSGRAATCEMAKARVEPAAPAPTHHRTTFGQAAALVSIERRYLDTVRIDGIRLRESRVEDALRWAEGRIAEGTFVRLIARNLPPNGVIGEYVSDEDAAAAWGKALESDHA